MITNTEAKCDRFGESLHSPKAYLEQITRSIKADKQELDRLSEVSKYTPEIKRRRTELSEAIERNLQHQRDIRRMLELPIGSWVKNGSTTPGRVVDLKIAGQIPEIHVLWWNHTVPVPERPIRLTLLNDSDLEYIWKGDCYPKLIRTIDSWECDEIEVLNKISGRLAVDKRSAMAKDVPVEEIELYRTKQTYIRKRIAWVNRTDLERLERVVRQGLEIFYRVGEALAEIRDRKLYKDLGYKTFQDYCIEKWDMKRRYADRLINSSIVINNLIGSENESHGTQKNNEVESESHGTQNSSPEKSIPNWGQNEPIAYQSTQESSEIVIPQSERVAREIGKAPKEKQSEVWKETCDRFGDNPTAKQVRSVVAEIINDSDNNKSLLTENDKNINKDCLGSPSTVPISCTDKPSTVPISCTDKPIVEGLKVGQIVQIRSDRTDKRLVGYNRAYGKIIAVNPASVDLKLLGGQTFTNVSPNDFQVIASVSLSAELSPEQLSCVIDEYGSFQEFVDRMLKLYD